MLRPVSNGDWDQSFVIPQDVKSQISIWLTLLTQWNGKEIKSGAGATLKKGNKIINTMLESQQMHDEDTNRQHKNPLVHQSPRWSNPRSISSDSFGDSVSRRKSA
ncbi:hypothetical protein ACTFIV_001564 [Dictyostelium citrinum]